MDRLALIENRILDSSVNISSCTNPPKEQATQMDIPPMKQQPPLKLAQTVAMARFLNGTDKQPQEPRAEDPLVIPHAAASKTFFREQENFLKGDADNRHLPSIPTLRQSWVSENKCAFSYEQLPNESFLPIQSDQNHPDLKVSTWVMRIIKRSGRQALDAVCTLISITGGVNVSTILFPSI